MDLLVHGAEFFDLVYGNLSIPLFIPERFLESVVIPLVVAICSCCSSYPIASFLVSHSHNRSILQKLSGMRWHLRPPNARSVSVGSQFLVAGLRGRDLGSSFSISFWLHRDLEAIQPSGASVLLFEAVSFCPRPFPQ
jgi:hypothetical protein